MLYALLVAAFDADIDIDDSVFTLLPLIRALRIRLFSLPLIA